MVALREHATPPESPGGGCGDDLLSEGSRKTQAGPVGCPGSPSRRSDHRAKSLLHSDCFLSEHSLEATPYSSLI